MQRLTLAGLVAVAGVALPAPALKPKAEGPPQSVVGVWECDSVTSRGKARRHDGTWFEFRPDGTFRAAWQGHPAREGEYQAGPREIDWKWEGNRKWNPGLFRVDGDALVICIDDGFRDGRPVAFEALADRPYLLMTFQRAGGK